MRIIIYTGKGGVGKTSVAAATGIKLADSGVKTLVISTDLAHSLADSYEVNLSDKPTLVRENLWAEELNPQSALEARWDKVHNFLVRFFRVMGLKDVFAEEMLLLPGMEELFSLLEIYHHYQKQQFAAIVLDFPPTASTVRLLSFFDLIGWYMEKFFKIKRKTVRIMRTFTPTVMKIPLPEDDVFDALAEIYEKMAAIKQVLVDPNKTAIRLVLNPEAMVINESQRAYTYLNLYGFSVDALIVNKVLPADFAGEQFSQWRDRQVKNIAMIKDIFQSVKIFTLPQMAKELKGVTNLQLIAKKLYPDVSPLVCFSTTKTIELEKTESGYLFKVYMPFLEEKKFDLFQKGVLLIITVNSYKRKIVLPQVLSNKTIKRAFYQDKYLQLYFTAE